MARREFNPGALTAPLPAVLVSVGNAEEFNLITIGWTGILSTHPPRTYISVRPERHSYGMLKESREFVINLTTAEMVGAVDFAGVFTGKKVDKLKECGLTAVESKSVAPPTIAESPLALECRVVEIIPMGTHDVFIADIVGITADEGIIDEKGRICFDRANLLAYAHGEYFALGEKLGAFGFSASKKAKRTEKDAPADKATQSAKDKNGSKHKDGTRAKSPKSGKGARGKSDGGIRAQDGVTAPAERNASKSHTHKKNKSAKTAKLKKKTPPVSRKKQKRGE